MPVGNVWTEVDDTGVRIDHPRGYHADCHVLRWLLVRDYLANERRHSIDDRVWPLLAQSWPGYEVANGAVGIDQRRAHVGSAKIDGQCEIRHWSHPIGNQSDKTAP